MFFVVLFSTQRYSVQLFFVFWWKYKFFSFLRWMCVAMDVFVWLPLCVYTLLVICIRWYGCVYVCACAFLSVFFAYCHVCVLGFCVDMFDARMYLCVQIWMCVCVRFFQCFLFTYYISTFIWHHFWLRLFAIRFKIYRPKTEADRREWRSSYDDFAFPFPSAPESKGNPQLPFSSSSEMDAQLRIFWTF